MVGDKDCLIPTDRVGDQLVFEPIPEGGVLVTLSTRQGCTFEVTAQQLSSLKLYLSLL